MASQDKPEKGSALRNSKKSAQAYLKYSTMGIQMGVIIGLFSFGGVKLDAWLNTDPAFTVILALFGVAAALYLFIKQLLVENKSEIDVEDEDSL
jgi:ATP synthase protein I